MSRRSLSRTITVLSITMAAACGGGDASVDGGEVDPDGGGVPPADAEPGPDVDVNQDIAVLLEGIDGLTVSERPPQGGYRVFDLTFLQPVDHDSPGGQTFVQQLVLLHRGIDRPVVLATQGYYLSDFPEEPTWLLDANQISVEHRYFEPSRPEPADWSFLRIAEAAGDHHRIVQAFEPIYGGAWINTGASKGGMTAVYHRRFFPDDVDGTVAYVAPISFGAPDDRYQPFFDTVGTAACRQDLEAFQREALERRSAMLARIEADAQQTGYSYDRVGGSEMAFEGAVTELLWAYWQYDGLASCDDIPGSTATDDQIYGFLDQVSGASFYSDWVIGFFEPYFYQAAAELGYPSVPIDHIADLLQFETIDVMPALLPTGVTVTHDPAAMDDIQSWVSTQGSELLFIYGEYDPWTGGAFELGQASDSFKLVVPQGNHGAGIDGLAPADRTIAIDALERWTGVQASFKPERARSMRRTPVLRLVP